MNWQGLYSFFLWAFGVVGGLSAIAGLLMFCGVDLKAVRKALHLRLGGWALPSASPREKAMAAAMLLTVFSFSVALFSFRKLESASVTAPTVAVPTTKPLTVHANIVWVRPFWSDNAVTDYLVMVRLVNNGPDALFNAWHFTFGPIPVAIEGWQRGSTPFWLNCGGGHKIGYTDKDLTPDHVRVRDADQMMLLFFVRVPGALTVQGISQFVMFFQDGSYNNFVTDPIQQVSDVATACYAAAGIGTYK